MKLSTLLKTPALALVIAIPILSVVVGGTMLYLAISTGDQSQATLVAPEKPPLSKTSWRGGQSK